MPRRLLSAAVVAVVVAVAGAAGAARADSVGCGSAITADTTLTGDLVGCAGDGLVVTGDNVTLDLAGHLVSGLGQGAGIRVYGRNVVVENGSVEAFGTGISTTDFPSQSPGATIENMKVRRNAGNGVELFGYGETLRSSTVAFNGNDGVLLGGSDRSTIVRNRIYRNAGTGVSGRPHADGARYIGNDVLENGRDGISMSESLALEITGNTVSRNGRNGIHIDEGTGSFPPLYVIARNAADDNGMHGIEACWTNYDGGNPCDGGFTDGGGNSAKHNALEPQCVNISCTANRGRI